MGNCGLTGASTDCAPFQRRTVAWGGQGRLISTACLRALSWSAHLAFFWVMTRTITLPLPAGDTGDAFQLTWIEPPASPRSTPPTPATTPVRRVRAPASTLDPPARAPAPVPTDPSVEIGRAHV